PLVFGFKVRNKKKLKENKKSGHIFISNHIHPLDSFLIGTYLFPKRAYFTMLESNLGLPFIGKLMRFLGGVPIPTKRAQLANFETEMGIALKKKHFVGFFPESALKPYHPSIRNFKKGAIHFALKMEVAIIPMVMILKKPKGIYKLYKRKPLIELHILDRYLITTKGTKRETVNYHLEALQKIVSTYFNEHSDIKEDNTNG
ncbi:MAG: 1-acyl-sn-glycerol-3-phosphate acyltransferase, partial [Acholeplasmataceae bacterium]|nr:1-acyl-sn-glycerol-3-phosphate acyltransferase [Acholeplasmataceae bacterium]